MIIYFKSVGVTGLTLYLLVLGVLTDDHDAPLALDYLALFTHRFYRRSEAVL